MNAKVYIALLSLLFFFQVRAQQDVGVSTMLAPLSGCSVGTSSTNINVIVRNYSLSSSFPNTITVRYRINAGPITSELIGAVLGPNASFNFTFLQTANLAACGTYQIKVWTQKAGDPNPLNDTLNYTFINDCTPVPGTITGPNLLCRTLNNDSLLVTGGSFSYGFQWYKQTVPGPFNATGNTTNKFYLNGLIDSTTYYIRYNGGLCPNVNSPMYGVGISPNIVRGTISPDLVLCINNVVGSVSLSGFVQNILDWQQSNNGGATWVPLGNNNSSVNINYLTSSALFRANVASGACGTKFSDTISVTVEPLVIPGTISGANTVCSGSNGTNLTLNGYANHFGLEWYSSTDNITFTPTGVFTPYFSTLNITQTTYYKVVLQGNICANAETPVITIFVDPQVVTGVVSPHLDLCETNITGSISISGYSIVLLDWQQSNDNGLTWFSTGINTPTVDISFLTASARFRAVIQSGACGVDYSSTIIVTVQPTVVPGSITGVNSACGISNSDTLTLVGNNSNIALNWYISNDNVNFATANVNSTFFVTNNITQTTYFYVIVNGGLCPADTTAIYTFNIDQPLNLGNPSPDLNLCSNNISGTVSISGFSSILLDWEQSNDGGSSWFSTGDNSTAHDISSLSATAHFRALISSGSCGSGYSDTIAVNVQPAIIPGTITAGNALCSGINSDTLILTGNANDFGFQWYSSIDNITFSPTGITNDTFIVTNLIQTTYYKVILIGIGCPNDETNVSTCIVSAPLNLGTTSSDLTLCANAITGVVSLTGFASTIVGWEQSNNGGVTWFSTGSNSSNHDISYLTASADFRAFVESGTCGNGYSDTISVVIENVIVPGSISGALSVCSGPNSDTLVLSGNSFDYGFQWYSATLNTSYVATGVTNDTLIVNNLTETTYFKVILTGNVCADAETSIFTVTIDAPLSVGNVSPDLFLCSNNITGSVSVSGYSTSIVDWEQSNDGGTTWFSTGSNSPSHNVSYLTANAHFRALIQSGTCGSGYSNSIAVVIENAIIPGSISGNTVVCSGTNIDTLILTGNANSFGFEWYSATLNTSFFATGVTNDTIIVTNLTETTYFKVILNGNTCPDEETTVFTVFVDQPLNLGTTSPNLSLCSSNISGAVSLSGYTATLVDWEQSNDGGATWFSTGISTNSLNISYLAASADFRALVQAGSCGSGYSTTISVVIENAIVPGTIAAPSSFCAGNNTDTLVLSGNSNDFGYQWYYATLNTSFFPTGVTNDTLIFTNLTETTYYKVILLGNICPNGETSAITITITPTVNLGTTSPDLALCSSNISGSVSLSGYATTIVDWEQSNDGGLTWFSTGTNTDSLDISYLIASADFRAFVQAGSCGSGYSDTISVVIENAILPGSISGTSILCSGANSDTLILTGNANDFGYQWYTATLNTSFFPTGVTNDTLILTNLTQLTYVKVILTGSICPNDETAVFTIQVDPPLNLGTTSSDLNLCSSNVTGNVSLSGFSSVIQEWQQSDDGGITWYSTGANLAIHDISYLTASASFRAIVNSGACGTGISDTINVNIEDAIVPGFINGVSALCAGVNTDTLILSGNANSLGYQWYSATLNTSFFPTGITNDTLIVNNLTQTTYFKVISFGNNCPSDETPVFTVQVDQPVVTGLTSPDLNLCINNVVGTISLTNFTSTILDWEQSNDGGATWFSTGSNTNPMDISFLTGSALFHAIVGSGTCGTGISNTISVQVDLLGVPASIGFNFDACIASPDLDSMKVLSHSGNIAYWQFSTNNGSTWSPTFISDSIYYANYLLQNTIYQLVTSHGACPNVVSNTIFATVNPLPNVSAGFDTAIILGTATQLAGSGGLFGVWTPNTNLSNPNLPSPNCYPPQTTTYGYTVIDANGCTNTDYVQISVVGDTTDFTFIIYNIITPNGDGKNDYFTIKGLNTIDSYLIKIFNANGNLVFSSKDYNNDWGATYKGELVPDGTYLYAIEIDHVTKYRGFLTIMRGND